MSLAHLREQSLVVASNNAKKLGELRGLLEPLGIRLVAQGELGVTEAEEPHPSFVENALTKARHASALTGLPALADDSGLCVSALGGAPGVASAHYADLELYAVGAKAGEAREKLRLSQDAANNAKLLLALEGQADRSAYYVCVLVLVMHAQDPLPMIAEGRWAGQIANTAQGNDGFGYDPLFFLPEQGCTVAQLAPAVKAARSHRAQAMAALVACLQAAQP